MRIETSLKTWIVVAVATLCWTGQAQATNFVVNSIGEPGTGTCDATECTLREAVDALAASGDQVLFDFSALSPPYLIELDSPLNVAQDGAVVDGLVCTGCGTVQGSTSFAAQGFDSVLAVRVVAAGGYVGDELIEVSGDGVTVRGLNVDGSPLAGFRVTQNNVTIEDCYVGTALDGSAGTGNSGSGIIVQASNSVQVGPGNVVSGNGGHGIYVFDPDSDTPTISGNIVGLDRAAQVIDSNSGIGVYVFGDGGLILGPILGGPAVGDGNVISGNGSHGILLKDEVDGNGVGLIANNVIGTDGAGTTSRANGGAGVALIGGTAAGQEPQDMTVDGNLIAGNVGDGILLQSCKADLFINNAIGTDFAGTAQLGNGGSGIYLFGAGGKDTKEHVIGGLTGQNLIAFNGDDGIRLRVSGSAKVKDNTIAANSIYSNVGIGIDIEAAAVGDGAGSPPPNVCADSNAWGNSQASAPVINTAGLLGGVLTVTGTACPDASVDIYYASADDEPQVYVGTGTATGAGAFAVAAPVTPGAGTDFATALQTNASGETGEAAAPQTIDAPCDTDGDGVDGSLLTCSGPDCDDTNPDTYPGAPEVCDGLDNDCDSAVPGDETDADLDTYAPCDGDCDDALPAVNPGALEICDGLDTDCNGAIPPGETDDDGDGDNECLSGDCDDTDATVYLGAPEICDEQDNDCDGLVPPDETDDDGDSFNECGDGDCDDGDDSVYPGAAEACDGLDGDCDGSVPANESDADGDLMRGCEGDCDDSDPLVFTGAVEICDGKDSDCDTVLPVDEADMDGDGAILCDDSDCDDTNAEVYEGAPELCDGVDNDCDGTIDEVEDADGDGITNCDGDCDDADAAVFPGAEEICDGKDSNCDEVIGADEQDDDGDGFYECDGGDCDDADADVNIDAEEVCDDGIDNDCSGGDAPCEQPCDDADVDGDGMSECDGDCDDADASVSSSAPEICDDGLDQDCDGSDVACASVTIDAVPPAGCDCEASVSASPGTPGLLAMLFGGLLLRRRRSGWGLAPAALGLGVLLAGCADIGGGTVQTWWGSLPDDGSAATFEAGGGFVAGAVAQAVDPSLVNDRSVVELIIGGDRHPLTCDGLQLLEAEMRSVEAGLLESMDAGVGPADLGGWACQELRGVAREVFGGDDWHAIHALLEPGDEARARPAAEVLVPGVFIGRVVDLSGPGALAPEPGVDGCAARVTARLESGPLDPGFLAESAVSRLDHKSVPAESLASVDLGAAVDVGLTFPEGLAGPAQEGTVELTGFASADGAGVFDTVIFSTEGEPIPTEPCASFGLTRSLAWPQLGQTIDDGDDR